MTKPSVSQDAEAYLTAPSQREESKWYVVRAKPRQELRALTNLRNQQIEAFMPQIAVIKIRRGRRTQIIEPMFPGYLFIELDHYQTDYYKVRSTYGVSKIITFGEQPAIVPHELIGALQTIAHSETPAVNDTTPDIGAKVEILQGPFKGMLAEVVKLDGDSRCIVLLDWLQQRVQASFSYDEITKIKI